MYVRRTDGGEVERLGVLLRPNVRLCPLPELGIRCMIISGLFVGPER